MVLEKVYWCEITVDVKEGYLGYDQSREVEFRIMFGNIICVKVNNLKEGESFGTLNKYHAYFLGAVMGRYPDCIYDTDAVMIEENNDGDQIHLDVTIWFESQHPSIFPIVREFIKACNELHPIVSVWRYK